MKLTLFHRATDAVYDHPCACATIRVLDDNDQPAGFIGELMIKGDNMMKGYYKDPETTARTLRADGWMHTGDLGYMDDDGFVFVTGRIKELIIKGGENIAPREIDEALLKHPAVLEAAASKPLMGVCVGMQMLLDHSEEQDTPGLGLIPGRVLRFRLEGRYQPDGSRYKVPQMGWNQVSQSAPGGVRHPVWGEVPDGAWFYFVHSYAAPVGSHSLAVSEYGAEFTAVARRGNFRGAQFHPERSARPGARLLANFLGWRP